MDNIQKFLSQCLVLDTETTSLDFKVAEIIEYAASDALSIAETQSEVDKEVEGKLYKASSPITPEISAITMITNRMVEGKPLFSEDLENIQAELDKYPYYVAHNALYDRNVLERNGVKLPKEICTMRLAKKLYGERDDITAFNLPYLRYALDLPVSDYLPAHRAGNDVTVTGILLITLLAEALQQGKIDANADDLGEELLAWLDEPVLITKMPFGKYKGQKLESIPLSYWQWAVQNVDSLQEDKPEYDADFAASVALVVEKAFAEKD